ncbi:phosphatase PAP2 family protein [Nocardioides sp. BP30]|uniref:phosphatase PAP2 family protein n=1 Tax=Nocardioides sp. BP30 TaxID=3036374 RepID=UPI002469617E|nr:phosphatase PAP2 family protein [Nocardioides sp. BP30]WGL52610.1 phosphatase PAP2 family protein [Nocardioides sp. BP30]
MTGRDSRHGPVAQLLIAWSPLSAILVLYAVAQWISAPLAGRTHAGGANRLGFALHTSGPRRIDEAVFGVLPSAWLQRHLVDGSTHWYDAVAALVYATHFVSIPLVTAFVWFRARDRFAAWLVSVLGLTLIGVTGYVVYPAAPPWLGSPHVERISRLGWHYLQLDPIARVSAIGQGDSNPVAAMPSLHAGAALLVSGFLWPLAHRWWRPVLALYVVLMALTLVYTGEHYAVDVVAGWATAAAGLAAGASVGRLRHRRPPPAAARHDESRPPPGARSEESRA